LICIIDPLLCGLLVEVGRGVGTPVERPVEVTIELVEVASIEGVTQVPVTLYGERQVFVLYGYSALDPEQSEELNSE
jgi:hypothetical protein